MKPVYTHISSVDYINNLTFEYIETYSLQRGLAFEEKEQWGNAEFVRLKEKKDKLANLTNAEEELLSTLESLFGYTQYLINGNGEFHPSCSKINTFHFSDPEVVKLKSILNIEVRDIPRFLCAPTYRDAIVFYNRSKEIVSTLNVCLGCDKMETKMFDHVDGDFETYDLLKRFFIEIGHDVEDPAIFSYDEIKKLREEKRK